MIEKLQLSSIQPRRYPGAPAVEFAKVASNSGGINFRKLAHLIPWLVRYSVLEPVRLWERWAYDRAIVAHKIVEPPIFILGHWRSGTSYLHQLMSLDPKLSTCTMYTSLFSDSFLTTERWCKPVLQYFSNLARINYAIQRIPLHWDYPAEEEVGMLCLSCPSSTAWGQVFPRSFNQRITCLTERRFRQSDPADETACHDAAQDNGQDSWEDNWEDNYLYFVKKLSLRANGRRLVLKSPANTARIEKILSLFPDARFIYIDRDPIEVFHSTRGLWQIIGAQSSLQTITDAQATDMTLHGYKKIVVDYLAKNTQIPEAMRVAVRFEELAGRLVDCNAGNL